VLTELLPQAWTTLLWQSIQEGRDCGWRLRSRRNVVLFELQLRYANSAKAGAGEGMRLWNL
jgi:hypothetical protein